MTTRNCKVRFFENNFAALTAAQIDYSSQVAAFPFSNAINSFRSKVWRPSGCFTITDSNNKLYYDSTTVNITNGKYTTPALLAAEIQTQLGGAWTVSHLTDTYKFKIENTSSSTLKLSNQTNAIWDTIGFTGNTDAVGLSFTAHEQRNHTEEYAIFDLGYAQEITAMFIIGKLGEVFSISSSATVTISGNNINSWDSPPYSKTLDRTSGGMFCLLDETTDTRYRFWRLSIIDKYNPLGPEGLSISHLYLGDHINFESRNINNGFSKQNNDPSTVQEATSGALYFNKKTKYGIFNNMGLGYLPRENKDTLEVMFEKLGVTTPFYISLDPLTNITDSIDELTRYVVFTNSPVFTHVLYDKFNTSISVREVV
jgi:hypothetical protein